MLTLSTRLSAFSYSIGKLASDMGRNFVVIGGGDTHARTHARTHKHIIVVIGGGPPPVSIML